LQKRIQDLFIGQKCVVVGYEKNSNNIYRGKLLSLGITKGTIITLEKVAPLGDPLEISLRGFKLSIRKNEANIILIEPLNEINKCENCSFKNNKGD